MARDPRKSPHRGDVLVDHLGKLHVMDVEHSTVPHITWQRQPNGALRAAFCEVRQSLESFKAKVREAKVECVAKLTRKRA